MITLMIIAGGLVYLLTAVAVSRRVLGAWTYNKWLRQRGRWPSITPQDVEDFRLHGDSAFVAGLVSVVALPIAAVYIFSCRGNSQWAILPKHVRIEAENRRQAARIAELEEQLIK